MSQLKAASLVAAGFAVCALLVPTGALSAAPSLVGIANTSGTHVASVDKAHQLAASESDPADAVVITSGVGGSSCLPVYTVPAGKALVLKTGSITGRFTGGGSTAGLATMWSGPSCDGTIWMEAGMSEVNGTVQTADQNFGSQLVFGQRTQIDVSNSGFDAGAQVILYGYLIPAAGAPDGAHGVSQEAPVPAP